MWKKVMFFILICILLGCSSQSKQRTYKDLFDEDDLAVERYSQSFLKEAKRKCPNILEDMDKLKIKLEQAEDTGSDNVRKKTEQEIKWLKGWADRIGCKGKVSMSQQPATDEGKPAASEVKPLTVTPLSFDECFTKCKELTDRTNEGCFDTCLGR